MEACKLGWLLACVASEANASCVFGNCRATCLCVAVAAIQLLVLVIHCHICGLSGSVALTPGMLGAALLACLALPLDALGFTPAALSTARKG
jgi:hypothetical protein